MRSLLLVLLTLVITAHADLPVAPQILAPKTPAESWNVIRLATDNVARLLDEKRPLEVPAQIALCSPALRTLAGSYVAPEHSQLVDSGTAKAAALINEIARIAQAEKPTAPAFAKLQAQLTELKTAYAPDIVSAEIHVCPQHPEHLTADPSQLCPTCQSKPRARRIPYSDIYVTPPVQPSATLILKDGVPQLTPSLDLLTVHGSTLRIIAIDPTLKDFRTSIDSALTGPYRVWASYTPAATALVETAFTDTAPFAPAERSPDDLADSLSTTVPGLKLQLAFSGGTGGPPPAKATRTALIKITTDTDEPVTDLQPHAQAFAHLTAISADCATLLQFHPTGPDVLLDTARAGPTLSFKTYFPRPGYHRLFCQIKRGDQIITAAFGINVGAE
jgi:hypothetical protein